MLHNRLLFRLVHSRKDNLLGGVNVSGFDLKEGFYKDQRASEDELWSAFTSLFSSQTTMVSSYKYGFLKAIIDNLYNVDAGLVLSFDQLFSKFAEIYWNLILKHKLNQQAKKETYLEQILKETVIRYDLPEGVPFESLRPDIMIEVSHQVKIKCKKYVVGALFEDTKQLFYSFSRTGEWLKINPQMYEFICKHKVSIEKLNYYEWARFLERVNDSGGVDHLLSKIDESAKRNNLSYYRDILFEEFEKKCFYCGKKVNLGNVEVDHFIPWSFIKDDNLWNFVLACPECNNKKRDKLADKRHLLELVERNSEIVIETHSDMRNYQQESLMKIYNWAMQNGYSKIWTPSIKRAETDNG